MSLVGGTWAFGQDTGDDQTLYETAEEDSWFPGPYGQSGRKPEFLNDIPDGAVGPHVDSETESALFEPFDSDGYQVVQSSGGDQSARTEQDAVADSLCATDRLGCEPTPQLVRFRQGSYQGSNAAWGYIHDDTTTGLSISTLDINSVFAVPLGSQDHLLILTPYLRYDSLNSAPALDLPDSLFDTGVKGFIKEPINDRLTGLFLLTPSIRSDFEETGGAFRLFGMALLVWNAIPQKLDLSGGVVYTGREDYPVLPAMGLLWTPAPEWRFDIQFPSPRISRRIRRNPGQSETWAYLSGVFGGNTWSVRRPSGTSDDLTLSDLRLMGGIEHLLNENRGFFGEIGYVFDRSLSYASLPGETELGATWMLRAGVSF